MNISNESMSLLEDLRVTTQQLFNEQKLSARQIIRVSTQNLPARIISHQYYGDSSKGKEIGLLNNEINVSFVSGEIDILTV